jgi:polysaccharide export outer membrane protein
MFQLNMKLLRGTAPCLALLLAAGCETAYDPNASHLAIPIAVPTAAQGSYLLGPLDKISVAVVGEPDLSASEIEIDAAGQIVLPVVGLMMAGGKTSDQLSTDIAEQLGKTYLRNPRVSVLIKDAVSQRVTVSGSVVEAGVFTLRGPTTLMQALAMAKGVDVRVANSRRVAIFRTTDKIRSAAYFDLRLIQTGRSPDPAILGGDVIVVEGSQSKEFWRELVGVLPGLGVFGRF